jgi:2-dehydro-3-deoxygluconokinase
MRPDLKTFDRVGGGDNFATSLIYAFLICKSAQEVGNYGAAHGALAMKTSRDTTKLM